MDLMGGKSQDVELTSTALPSRGLYWVVFLVTWTPETTGPAGNTLAFRCHFSVLVALFGGMNAVLTPSILQLTRI